MNNYGGIGHGAETLGDDRLREKPEMYTSKFLYRIAEQLRSEIRAGCKGVLLDYLRGHRFWLRAEAILFIKDNYPFLLQD